MIRITHCPSSQMTGLQRSKSRQSQGNIRLCFVLFLEQRQKNHESLTQYKTAFSDCPKKSETFFSLNETLYCRKVMYSVSFCTDVCAYCMCACSVLLTLLHECSRHLAAEFPHTLWLAPLTAFGNVCLQSFASLPLEHTRGKLADLCAIRHVLIGPASALVSSMRMVSISVLLLRSQRCDVSPILPNHYSCHPPNQ